MRIDHSSTTPVQRDKVPGQRSADGRNVNDSWALVVQEIRSGEVDKVNDQYKLSDPKVAARP